MFCFLRVTVAAGARTSSVTPTTSGSPTSRTRPSPRFPDGGSDVLLGGCLVLGRTRVASLFKTTVRHHDGQVCEGNPVTVPVVTKKKTFLNIFRDLEFRCFHLAEMF